MKTKNQKLRGMKSDNQKTSTLLHYKMKELHEQGRRFPDEKTPPHQHQPLTSVCLTHSLVQRKKLSQNKEETAHCPCRRTVGGSRSPVVQGCNPRTHAGSVFAGSLGHITIVSKKKKKIKKKTGSPTQ